MSQLPGPPESWPGTGFHYDLDAPGLKDLKRSPGFPVQLPRGVVATPRLTVQGLLSLMHGGPISCCVTTQSGAQRRSLCRWPPQGQALSTRHLLEPDLLSSRPSPYQVVGLTNLNVVALWPAEILWQQAKQVKPETISVSAPLCSQQGAPRTGSWV